ELKKEFYGDPTRRKEGGRDRGWSCWFPHCQITPIQFRSYSHRSGQHQRVIRSYLRERTLKQVQSQQRANRHGMYKYTRLRVISALWGKLVITSSFLSLTCLLCKTTVTLHNASCKSEADVGVVVVSYVLGVFKLLKVSVKEYYEIPWANLRAMVEPSFAERSLIHHKDYLSNGRLMFSRAINISNSEVLTADGHSVAYDFLVIATGHNDPIPRTKTERLKQYQAENEKIISASSILIVGGGPTGVELAGEIAFDFPEKRVTLVHNGPRLLEFLGPKASNKTLNWLKSRKVEVKLDQRVNLKDISEGNKTYLTSAGETIKADCHFLCTGKPLGSAWLRETVLKDSLDDFGMLKVDENLRIKDRRNIFAIGDITDVKASFDFPPFLKSHSFSLLHIDKRCSPSLTYTRKIQFKLDEEIKQGYLAQKHALVAAKNIKLLLSGGNESKMATYGTSSIKAIVSLGRQDAVAQFPFTTMIGLIPGLIKSKDLFVGKTRKTMGLDPHIVSS
ncbi:hypothetical protein RJ639_034915, partial [Escallonia herrerae]